MTQYKKPFSKLTNLYINIETRQTGPVKPFGELFPNLKTLFLVLAGGALDSEANKLRFIESEMPQLEELKFVINTINRSKARTVHQQIGNMLKKNPQIRELVYGSEIEDLIDIVNEHLVNLEHLIIQGSYPRNISTHFDHVKMFSVETSAYDMSIEKITFSQLNTLRMLHSVWYVSIYSQPKERDSWLVFLNNHQYLKNINCTVNRYKTEGFVDFLAHLPHLETIGIQSEEILDVDVISQLMDDHEHLLTLDYRLRSSVNTSKSDLSTYLEKLGNKWQISHYVEGRWLGLMFTKKN